MEGLSPEAIAGAVGLLGVALAWVGFWVWRSRQQISLEVEEPAAELEARQAPPAVEAPAEAPVGGPSGPDLGLAERFFKGLARSRAAFARSLGLAFAEDTALDERLQQLEEALITADVGVRTSTEIVAAIRDQASPDTGADELRTLLRAELLRRIGPGQPLAAAPAEGPLVLLVVGVNGSGKTTTIGKLAARYVREGRSVILAAGDTFRAGAIEQLKVWGERAGVPVIAHKEGADPAAVVFDAVTAGVARGADVVICDTAGRLQAQKTLMDELAKVVRVMRKAKADAPHEVLIVLDGTIGQNALSQARVFKEVVGVTGVALTKLDGTARGGVVVAVQEELGLPVKLVGLGEGIEDLRDFDPQAFVHALLGGQEQAS